MTRRAVVTGGTRGIGAAVAARLAAAGMEVVTLGREDADLALGAERLAEDMAHWHVDVLVNCAGENATVPAAAPDVAVADRLWRVNVLAPALLCGAVLPGMRARRWGRIVTVGSVLGLRGRSGKTLYGATKAAVAGLTRALAVEAAPDVLVNCVSPGLTDTAMTRAMLDDVARAAFLARVPLGRLLEPAEVAALVAWLAGEENAGVTGQDVAVDGGFACA